MFQPEFLSSQQVSFDVTHDTIIKTRHGMIVRIPAGSLQTTGNPVVTIEIKEAGSIAEMIKSGLATQSDGKLLSSAGLLYINPVGEDQVRINKPISVAIPTSLIDDSMKLYTGELNEDSSMNWIEPKYMLDNPQVKAMQSRVVSRKSATKLMPAPAIMIVRSCKNVLPSSVAVWRSSVSVPQPKPN